ncbi:MAG: hypothetical protein EOP61_21750 [Sphingomonadales bacterium]|nr:MAG: hypothetical protein EOP61_21750 [Sphingomonadales bacterium]
MSAIAGAAIGFGLAALAGLLLLSQRYRLRPKSFELPFLKFDTSRFADLSAIQLFTNVSKVAIFPSSAAQNWLLNKPVEATPMMLIHVGWHIVCDAFVKNFGQYPSEENVQAHVHELGSQNAEFILTFAKIYAAAISHAEDIPYSFAEDYFMRAPSLGVRLSQSKDVMVEDFTELEIFKIVSMSIRAG